MDQFQGLFRFLSNFWVSGSGHSVEPHYQASKTTDRELRQQILSATPGEAKKLGKKLKIDVPDWETSRVGVMEFLLEEKFVEEPLRTWLRFTGDAELVEGNKWGDRFWGVDLATGEGENTLGRLLMGIREKITSDWVLNTYCAGDYVKTPYGTKEYITEIKTNPVCVMTEDGPGEIERSLSWIRDCGLVGCLLPNTAENVWGGSPTVLIEASNVYVSDIPALTSFLQRWEELWG